MRRFALFSMRLLLAGMLIGFVAVSTAQEGDERVYLPIVGRGVASTPSPTTNPTNPPAPTGNLAVSAATYLGGAGNDSATALDVAPDGTIIVGGVLPGVNLGSAPITLLGGGDGAIMRLDSAGRKVLSVSRIGASVSDLEVSADGRIATCGDFGIAMLDSAAKNVVWSVKPGSGSRCAIGGDGTVAVMGGGSAYVYDASGKPLGNWAIGGSAQNDIAVDSANQQVIATGFTQVSGNLQTPFIRSWSYSGALKWKSYDFGTEAGKAGGADSRGERIAIGRDGKLYFAGSINGGTGVSVFARDPKNINQVLGKDKAVSTDNYNTPTNVGSVKMTWYGRYNPVDGTLELGQSLLTRLGPNKGNKGNSIGVDAIMADETGAVYLSGGAAASIANRDTQQVAGVTVGPYSGDDAYVLVVQPDFKQRRVWTVFGGPSGGSGGGRGVSVRGNVAAVAATMNNGTMITHNAVQQTPAGGTETYVAVWPK
jgi:hypothetical protein